MNDMKTTKLISRIALVCATLYLVSCAKNDETKPAESGDDRDKFAHTWTCNEVSKQVGTTSFPVIITKSSNAGQILIENFYNYGSSTKAVTNVSVNTLLISPQILSGNTVKGSGTWISATQVSLAYTVDNGSGTIDTCTATLSNPQ